jgi:hypothetical protein
MPNPYVVLSQLRMNQKVENADVYFPKKMHILFIPYLILVGALLFLPCTAFYGLIFMAIGERDMIATSFWPMYINYPFLLLPLLFMVTIFPYLVWRFEQQKRDIVLVLFPDGFLLYRHWKDERCCQMKAVEYDAIDEIIRKTTFQGISLDVYFHDKKKDVIFLTTKMKDSSLISEKISKDFLHFLREH